MQPERQVLKLSDAFMNPEEDPALELKVVMLNINLGRNKELMEQCHTLLEYAQFVDRLRTCEKSMGREEAVKHTVDTCIREGILRDFLLKYREEAIEQDEDGDTHAQVQFYWDLSKIKIGRAHV